MSRLVALLLSLLFAPSAVAQEALIGGGVFGGSGALVIKQPMMTTLVSPSDGATAYFTPVAAGYAGVSSNSTPGNEGALIDAPGTISNLTVDSSFKTASGGWTFTLYHSTGGLNGTFNSTTVACTMTNASSCTSTNSFSVAQGDAITIQSAPSGQSSTGTFNVSFLFTSNTATGFLWTSGANGSPTAGNYYPLNNFVTGTGNSLEYNISDLIPASGTISNLVFGVRTTPTSGASWTATVNHETAGNCGTASATSLSATISNGQYTQYDTTSAHAFTVAPNDCVSVQVTDSGGAASINQWSVGFQWTPTNPGEYPLMESGPTVPAATASGTRYLTVSGNIATGGSTSESSQYQSLTPVNTGAYGYSTLTAQDLSYLQSTTIGGAGRSAFTLRSAGASQCPAFSSSALSSSVSGGNTTGSCSGGVGNAGALSPDSLIDVLTTMGGSNGNTATWSKTSMGVVVR